MTCSVCCRGSLLRRISGSRNANAMPLAASPAASVCVSLTLLRCTSFAPRLLHRILRLPSVFSSHMFSNNCRIFCVLLLTPVYACFCWPAVLQRQRQAVYSRGMPRVPGCCRICSYLRHAGLVPAGRLQYAWLLSSLLLRLSVGFCNTVPLQQTRAGGCLICNLRVSYSYLGLLTIRSVIPLKRLQPGALSCAGWRRRTSASPIAVGCGLLVRGARAGALLFPVLCIRHGALTRLAGDACSTLSPKRQHRARN